MLTLLSVPAGALIAIRTQYSELLRELIERKETRKLRANFSQANENFSQKPSSSLPHDWRRLRPMLSEGEVSNMVILTPAQVRDLAGRHNVTEQTVCNWRMQAKTELNMKNGGEENAG